MTEGPAAEGTAAAAEDPEPGPVGEGASDPEAPTPPTYEELEAQLAEVSQRALDYQFTLDVPNNRVVCQRIAGPTVYQESWDPVFARRFIESMEAMLGDLKRQRSEFVAQMRKLAEDEAPGGPRLWTPDKGPLPGGPPMPNRAQRRAAART